MKLTADDYLQMLDGKDVEIKRLRLALEQITLVAGNLSDRSLAGATGANDARYRGQMLCDARNIAHAALEQSK